MNKLVFYIVLFLTPCGYVLSQQNLIPNPSLEEYSHCPNSVNGFYIDACDGWWSASLGTPDYFNACSTDTFPWGAYQYSVPQNYHGFQYAHTGIGYGGIGYTQLDDTSSAYAEYMQVEFLEPLKPNAVYRLSFFVHNPSTQCPNSIGGHFSSSAIFENTDDRLTYTPHFQSDLSFFICDTVNWIEMSGYYLAEGGEKFLVIGVFTPLYQLLMSDYEGNILSGPGSFGANLYLYVDDFELIEASYQIPNVFTPNGDLINDVFSIDTNLIDASEFTVFNRWGSMVYESRDVFEWDGRSGAKECTEGIYFYRLVTQKDNVRSGFITLTR